jgi:pimeloyl-ACP methyl ester carboxylesterase
MKRIAVIFFLALLACGGVVRANPHETDIPLRNGSICLADVSRGLAGAVGIPRDLSKSLTGCLTKVGRIKLAGIEGWIFVHALHDALGDGFSVDSRPDALTIRWDPAKLPGNWDQTRVAIRKFTETAAPRNTSARMREMGLWLPPVVDANRPLIVLIPGLDSDATVFAPLIDRLRGAGYQVAVVNYLSDRPLADSVAFVGQQLAAFHNIFPDTPIRIITHSMGGLVARGYIEGPDYTGGVDRLIMIAPPNHGSTWAAWQPVEQIHFHYLLWRHDPNFRLTWCITDGLCEVADDLKPCSPFLIHLNRQHRRDGVRYTIIAGDRPIQGRVEAQAVESIGHIVPKPVRHWWGISACEAALQSAAARLRGDVGGDGINRIGAAAGAGNALNANKEPDDANDGPVTVNSASLDGVSDMIILPADHYSIYHPIHHSDPPAWPIIFDRLAH